MDSSRLDRIQSLCHDAACLSPSEQHHFLSAACGNDTTLLADVLALLHQDAGGDALLDRDLDSMGDRAAGEAPPPPYLEFGPYRLTQILGESGMGVVYLAERYDGGSVAAIKIMRDAWSSPARHERFAAAQQVLAHLNHPFIARLYGAGALADGRPWFEMEYIDGLPITEYCYQRHSHLKTRLKLFRAVCETVLHAHRHAVIHSGLKPSNILVKDDDAVRLLDFGTAGQLEDRGSPAEQMRSGLWFLTTAYAAPEQIRGENTGVHTDVYSLGVILYELLAGRFPFDLSNLTPHEAEDLILRQHPERPSRAARRTAAKPHGRGRAPSAGKSAWADLDVLCLTAMHKDPHWRYRSVEALIRDVDHFLKGKPLEARPGRWRYRLRKFVTRNRVAVAASALLLITAVSATVFFTLRLAAGRDTAMAEAARTQRIQRLMVDLFEGGDRAAGPAENLRVATLLDRGVREARSLDREPQVQSDIYHTLGSIYRRLGDLPTADMLLHSALDQRRSIFGRSHPHVAESLSTLGLLRVDQARLEEAERLAREGLEMSKQTLPPGHPAVARATTVLGRVLEERGEHGAAIVLMEEAIRLYNAAGEHTPELAAAIAGLAGVHFDAGHYTVSDSLNRRALLMYRQLHGERHPRVADILASLGDIQFEQRRYPDAEQLYRQAAEISDSWYGKDHPRTASHLMTLGRALVSQERYNEALDLFRQALAIQERVYGQKHLRVASSLNEFGTAALKSGDLDAAEDGFRRMANIYRAVHGERHYLTAVALSYLANVYMEKNDNAKAERTYRDVLRRFNHALSPDHINTGIAHIELGRALIRQKRYSDAEVHILSGYGIVAKQPTPSVPYLQGARRDLISVYEATKQPELAELYRAELAAEDAKSEAARAKTAQ